MFPLGTVLFPGAPLALQVFEPRYLTMLSRMGAAGETAFGVVLISRGSEVGGGDRRTSVGTLARIEQLGELATGRIGLLARGERRIRVRHWLDDDPHPQAEVEDFPDPDPGPGDDALAPARGLLRRIESLCSELDLALPEAPPRPESLWGLCARLPVNALDRQALLEAETGAARLALLVELATAGTDDLERVLAGG
ncbi:MAG: LON peptidase substrate-binding domain-containing protein [Acidimicrobiales bacterium]